MTSRPPERPVATVIAWIGWVFLGVGLLGIIIAPGLVVVWSFPIFFGLGRATSDVGTFNAAAALSPCALHDSLKIRGGSPGVERGPARRGAEHSGAADPAGEPIARGSAPPR